MEKIQSPVTLAMIAITRKFQGLFSLTERASPTSSSKSSSPETISATWTLVPEPESERTDVLRNEARTESNEKITTRLVLALTKNFGFSSFLRWSG